jgi:tagatose-1,6-bisphosphate aldolase
MGLRLTEQKKLRLKAVADARGVITALAIDQRSALRKLFGKAMNVASDSVPGEKLVQLSKGVPRDGVFRMLVPHAGFALTAQNRGQPFLVFRLCPEKVPPQSSYRT